MRYIVDHDLHIHSWYSPCSRDPEQTTERILRHAVDSGFKTICLTDHFWDSAVPCENNGWSNNNYEKNSVVLPLPRAEGVRYLFGCEADMNRLDVIGITPETCEKFDFVIVPTNHLHMTGFTADPSLSTIEDFRESYLKRLNILLASDLPLRKVGIAHLTCHLAYKTDPLTFYDGFSREVWEDIFRRAAAAGCGIELNFNAAELDTDQKREVFLRPYRVAKEQGCRFYFGSDAHHPAGLLKAKANFEQIVDLLNLTEDDKYHIPGID